jgi:hypothetical protein
MKSYSRRELYAAGECLGDSSTVHKVGGGRIYGGGGSSGGGGSTPAPTQTTVQNTNVPEYARPYVETMLGTAQQQIFNYDDAGNVTSMKPYVPYSANPTDYIAGFSPLQQQAQSNIANMQTPTGYATGADYATTAGLGAMGTANPAMEYGGLGATYGGLGAQAGLGYGQNATNAQAVGAYMNPYLQNVLSPAMQLQNQQFGQINAQNQGQATQQGAFGGGRQAVMQGLNQQNQMLAQNQLVGNAYNQAYDTAQKNMQAAASLGMQGTAQGMQGAGMGLQGVQGAQAAYQQLGAQGANLANISGQQAQTELGINAAQQASGAAQQAQQQNVINQAVQNYATQQQYPMLQLANMSSLLRGLPMQSATTQTYQAAPSAVSTLGGLGATALGAYGAAGGFKGAKGGLPKDFEHVKKFDVGGAVESDLYDMDDAHLMEEAKTSPSTMIRQQAAKILAERRMEQQAMAQGVGAAAPTFHAAGGGIVAFNGETGSEVEAPKLTEKEAEAALYGRLPAGSVKRLEPTKDLGNYEDASNAMGEVIPSNAGEGSFSKWWKEHTFGTKENLGIPVPAEAATPTKQAAALPPANTGAKPDALGRYPAAPISGAPTGGIGGTDQAKGYGFASTKEDKDYQAQVGKLGTQIDKLTEDLNKGLSSGKAQSDLDALREEIKDKQDQKLWLSLMAGGAKAMASKSPFANVGVGEGVGAGVESYAQAAKAEREDKKLLIAQQSALEQAEYARKTGNLNALIAAQSRLDQIKAHRDTLKAQYAQIGATKEAQLEASKQKTYADQFMKALALDPTNYEGAKIAADKAMQMTPANTISFSDLGKKKS